MEQPSADELLRELAIQKDLLAAERKRSASLVEELRHAKEQSFLVQKQCEQEEEFITNRLTKRLMQLKQEKQNLANEVEQEEEYLINGLQKRLTEVTREKVDLERRLEQEQEYITNRLSKQVERLASEKTNLQKEKGDLQRQVTELGAAVQKLAQDKCLLESAMEMEEEAVVNRLQRQIETLLSNYRILEHQLEANGVNVKQLPVQPMETDTDFTYGGRRGSRGGRERSLSVSSGGSRRSSINEIRLQRTSSSATPQPSQ